MSSTPRGSIRQPYEAPPRMHHYRSSHPADQRGHLDRRQRPTPWWTSFRVRGKRRGARRTGEGPNTYVDQPTRRVTVLVGLITVASVLDALLTLLYLHRGGGEANPVMAFALQSGPTMFLLIKMGCTGLGVTLLALHQHFRVALPGLYGIACLYLLLLGYHGVLWLWHPSAACRHRARGWTSPCAAREQLR